MSTVPTPAPTDARTPFSTRIREATTEAHRDAERAPYLAALVSGRLDLAGYGRLVVQHRAIYAALEAPHDSASNPVADDPVAAAFLDPAVVRLPALERDLVDVLGADWATRPEAELMPTTEEYCERLRDTAATWPGGWVGHHYVRYLGDLSGGRFIRRAIEDALGIDETSGTAFYDFPTVPDPDAWKDRYRGRLDAADWDDAERDRIVAEILAAYDLNTRLLEELGERV